MVTWPEATAQLARYPVVLRDDRSLVIAVRVGDTKVRVRGECVTAFEEDWLLVLAPVLVEERARLRDALALNMRLALSTLAIEQGWLVVRATQPLARLDARTIARTVEHVAQEALRLRSLHPTEPTDAEQAFSHFGE